MSYALHSYLKVYTVSHTCGRVSQLAPTISVSDLHFTLASRTSYSAKKSRKQVCLSDDFVSYLFLIILILQLCSLSLSNALKYLFVISLI